MQIEMLLNKGYSIAEGHVWNGDKRVAIFGINGPNVFTNLSCHGFGSLSSVSRFISFDGVKKKDTFVAFGL